MLSYFLIRAVLICLCIMCEWQPFTVYISLVCCVNLAAWNLTPRHPAQPNNVTPWEAWATFLWVAEGVCSVIVLLALYSLPKRPTYVAHNWGEWSVWYVSFGGGQSGACFLGNERWLSGMQSQLVMSSFAVDGKGLRWRWGRLGEEAILDESWWCHRSPRHCSHVHSDRSGVKKDGNQFVAMFLWSLHGLVFNCFKTISLRVW